MSLTFQCSNCDSLIKIPENLAGKKVRCGRCQAVVMTPPPLVADLIDDEEIPATSITSRPSPVAHSGAHSGADSGARSRQALPGERPRRRSRPEPASNSNLGLWIGLGVGGVLVLLVGVVVAAVLVHHHSAVDPPVAQNNFPAHDHAVDPAMKIELKKEKRVEPRVEPRDFWDDPNPNPPPKKVNPPAAIPANAVRIELKAGAADVQGMLNNFDPRVPDRNMIHKPYVVTLQANKTYTIDMIGPGFDPYLYLFSPAGQLIDEDDDGGDGLDSQIRFTARETGPYKIYAAALFGSGAFQLKIRADGADVLDGNAVTVIPLKNGSADVAGVLNPQDPIDPIRNAPHKRYQVMLQANKSYVIDMMAQFDTYLYLYSPEGQLLVSDDDGGEGFNSRIRYRPTQTGLYRIHATAFGGGTGAFDLKIRSDDNPNNAAPPNPFLPK